MMNKSRMLGGVRRPIPAPGLTTPLAIATGKLLQITIASVPIQHIVMSTCLR